MSAIDNANSQVSKGAFWTGSIIGGLPALFLLVDGVFKIIKPAKIVEYVVNMGFTEGVILPLGLVLTASAILYFIPRTAILGAILLTGYLGGASATHVYLKGTAFEILFPPILGVLLWGGIYLRDTRLQALIPFRK